MMTLDQLKIFVAVAERQHLTRAAAALNLTPSTVSAAIHALEERYTTRLFHRVGRGIELSEAGRIFLVEAKATLSQARAAELALSELGGLQRGALVVAASQTLANYWLPPRLIRFKAMHPAIDLQLVEGNTASVTRTVLDGGADLGFVEGRIDEPALAVRAVAHDRLVVVAAPDHPLTRRANVGNADLAAADWIVREAGSGTREVLEDLLRAGGLDPQRLRAALNLPSNEAICAALCAGGLLAAVSELVAAPHVDSGRLRRVAFDLPPRLFTMLRHKERYRSRAAEAFEAILDAGPPSRSRGASP